jgi:hypothetical protein
MAGALLMVAALVPTASAASVAPKVAIIVGPVGSPITDDYRAAANAAASAALQITPNVVKVYSPNATWPAVRAAVDGASVVVYLGHGNGWPSRYSSTLQPQTQDGFGLNPVAGVDDIAHQYYGESFVSTLHLSPGAVVMFSHLCYASGSSEPGLSDGTFSDVLSRVDNFAAGFFEAGAGAVVAEGHQDPAPLMAAAIRGPAAVAKAWANASWGHGHETSYASTRTPGASLTLDPNTPTSGYYRSIARAGGARGRLTPAPVAVTPASLADPVASGPPSLASSGARFGPAIVEATVAPGTNATVKLPVTQAASALPATMLVGVRWLPLVAGPIDPGNASTAPGLVVGEESADVVATSTATRQAGGLQLNVAAPTTPGTYVVLMTLEASDGTPYDVATQALVRPFTVVVPNPVDMRITAPSTLAAQPGTPVSFNVNMANTGSQPWGSPLYASMWTDPTIDPALGQSFDDVLSLNAVWLDTVNGTAVPAASYPLPRSLGAPGQSTDVNVSVLAPTQPGQYLLVLSLGVKGDLGTFPQQPLLVPATIDASEPSPSPSASPGASAPVPSGETPSGATPSAATPLAPAPASASPAPSTPTPSAAAPSAPAPVSTPPLDNLY